MKVSGLAALWIGAVLLMGRSYAADPYNPALQGTSAYGHNHDGALLQGAVFSLAELAIVYLILRPWSYDRSWLRSFSVLVIFTPWTFVLLLSLMHAGSVHMIHVAWACLILVICFVSTIWSGLAVLLSRP